MHIHSSVLKFKREISILQLKILIDGLWPLKLSKNTRVPKFKDKFIKKNVVRN
jgi:hypothetical protein